MCSGRDDGGNIWADVVIGLFILAVIVALCIEPATRVFKLLCK